MLRRAFVLLLVGVLVASCGGDSDTTTSISTTSVATTATSITTTTDTSSGTDPAAAGFLIVDPTGIDMMGLEGEVARLPVSGPDALLGRIGAVEAALSDGAGGILYSLGPTPGYPGGAIFQLKADEEQPRLVVAGPQSTFEATRVLVLMELVSLESEPAVLYSITSDSPARFPTAADYVNTEFFVRPIEGGSAVVVARGGEYRGTPNGASTVAGFGDSRFALVEHGRLRFIDADGVEIPAPRLDELDDMIGAGGQVLDLASDDDADYLAVVLDRPRAAGGMRRDLVVVDLSTGEVVASVAVEGGTLFSDGVDTIAILGEAGSTVVVRLDDPVAIERVSLAASGPVAPAIEVSVHEGTSLAALPDRVECSSSDIEAREQPGLPPEVARTRLAFLQAAAQCDFEVIDTILGDSLKSGGAGSMSWRWKSGADLLLDEVRGIPALKLWSAALTVPGHTLGEGTAELVAWPGSVLPAASPAWSIMPRGEFESYLSQNPSQIVTIGADGTLGASFASSPTGPASVALVSPAPFPPGGVEVQSLGDEPTTRVISGDPMFPWIQSVLGDREGGLVFQYVDTPPPYPDGTLFHMTRSAATPVALYQPEPGWWVELVDVSVRREGPAALARLTPQGDGRFVDYLVQPLGDSAAIRLGGIDTRDVRSVTYANEMFLFTLQDRDGSCCRFELRDESGSVVATTFPLSSSARYLQTWGAGAPRLSDDGAWLVYGGTSHDGAMKVWVASLLDPFAGWSRNARLVEYDGAGTVLISVGGGLRLESVTGGFLGSVSEGDWSARLSGPVQIASSTVLATGAQTFDCSAALIGYEPLAAQQLPPAVAATRQAIGDLARRCDLTGLADMAASQGTFRFSVYERYGEIWTADVPRSLPLPYWARLEVTGGGITAPIIEALAEPAHARTVSGVDLFEWCGSQVRIWIDTDGNWLRAQAWHPIFDAANAVGSSRTIDQQPTGGAISDSRCLNDPCSHRVTLVQPDVGTMWFRDETMWLEEKTDSGSWTVIDAVHLENEPDTWTAARLADSAGVWDPAAAGIARSGEPVRVLRADISKGVIVEVPADWYTLYWDEEIDFALPVHLAAMR